MIPIGSLVQIEYDSGAALQYAIASNKPTRLSNIYVVLSIESMDIMGPNSGAGLIDAYKLLGPDGCLYYCELGWPTKFKVISEGTL